jgi:hypothetical protein
MAVLAICGVLAAAALADLTRIHDPQGDVQGASVPEDSKLDVRYAVARHNPDTPSILVHKIGFYDPNAVHSLEPGNAVEPAACVFLYTHRPATTFYRRLCVSYEGDHSEPFTDSDGKIHGRAQVSFPSSNVVRFSFPRRRLPDAHRRYFWRVETFWNYPQGGCQGNGDPCTDRAPDSGVVEHTLPHD